MAVRHKSSINDKDSDTNVPISGYRTEPLEAVCSTPLLGAPNTNGSVHEDRRFYDSCHLYGSTSYEDSNAKVLDNTATNTPPRSDRLKSSQPGIEKLPFILISVVTTLFGVSSKFNSTLVDQYVYQRFALDILGNTTYTTKDPCFTDPHSNVSSDVLVEHVQDLASTRLLYLEVMLYILGIPSSLVLGTLSRTISRKAQLLVPVLGYTFKCGVIVVVAYLNLDLNWIYLGYAVDGLSGSYCSVLLGVFLYASDITNRNSSRTAAMVILEGAKGIIPSALNIAVGDLIQTQGFILPALLAVAAALATVAVIIVLPNRKPTHPYKIQRASTTTNARQGGIESATRKRCLQVFFFPEGTFKNRDVKKMFISAYWAAFFYLIANIGIKRVETLYIMDRPVCWSSETIGWFLFAQDLSYNIFSIFIAPALIRCFPGMIIGVIGNISNCGGFIFYAFASTGVQLFFQPLVDIAHGVPIGFIRGELSRLIEPESQGTLFATIAVMESFCFALGTPALYVYNVTLNCYKGTVMLAAAAMALTAALILMYFQKVWRRYYKRIWETFETNTTPASSHAEPT